MFVKLAENDLNISDRLDALDRKFTDIIDNMNTEMEKLFREVASVQITSAQSGFMEPQGNYRQSIDHLGHNMKSLRWRIMSMSLMDLHMMMVRMSIGRVIGDMSGDMIGGIEDIMIGGSK